MPNLVEVTYKQTGELKYSVVIEYLAEEIYDKLNSKKENNEFTKI